MAKRQLSKLQQAYKNFFLAMLDKYGVDSPAKLSYEAKREFFTQLKGSWKIQKLELAQEVKKQIAPSKKSQYSKVKSSKPPIAMEQEVSFAKRSEVASEGIEKIPSEPNPEQTDDLKIKYHPNQFFEQDNLYAYPVVKMPAEGSYLKLPRTGRAFGKGFKEDDFYQAIISGIEEIEVYIDLHLVIPYYNRPYEPDFVLIDRELNLYIDIEIDEPYDGYYRFPTHEYQTDEKGEWNIKKDETRDLFFTESGWVVIRFTERQVHLQENQCIAFIKDVLDSIRCYKFDVTSICISEEQWDYQQAIRWEKEHYREKYLGIERFGQQIAKSHIVVDIEESEGIEENLKRTIKFKSNTPQDNIAFEDETHIYHHPKDATGNAEYISVTTLIDRFFPFDMERFIQGKSKRDNKTEEEVLTEFITTRDEAAEKGTHLHEQIERFLKGQDFDSKSKEFTLFKKFYEQIIVSKGFELVEAEKRILLDDFNIAGTVDALFKKRKSNDYIIVDWKRSKKLTVDGNPKKYGYGYALSELSHLDNSSYYKYALQQNIYKYILEKKYSMPISSMNLIVLHENYETYHRIPLVSMDREVFVILKSINHKI